MTQDLNSFDVVTPAFDVVVTSFDVVNSFLMCLNYPSETLVVDPLMWRTSFDVNRMLDVSYSSLIPLVGGASYN